MKTKLAVAMSLFLANTALCADLDKVIAQVNHDLNPEFAGDIGYEAGYRQQMDAGHIDTWVNVSRVKRICEESTTFYIVDRKLVSKTKNDCVKRPVSDPYDLRQVMCRTSTGKKCVNALAKGVSTSTVIQMILQKIERAYVE